MSSINPNSVIRILKGVPLEKDYINTLYFGTISAQTTYFQGKTKTPTSSYTLQHQSYQRVNKGVFRVNIKIEDLYDCNYIMFQNTSFENKWFYAFINSLEYVNNVTTDIYYEIDVMQTWMFEMSLTRCFVEREHSVTDEIGDNIVAEPVDIGELVFNWYTKLYEDLDKYAIVMAVTTDEFDQVGDIGGNVVNGIYSATKLWVEPATTAGATDLSGKIANDYAQRPDEIVAIYMCPLASLPRNPIDEYDQPDPYWLTDTDYLTSRCQEYILPSANPQTGERDDYKINSSFSLDGYHPKNNKLFTFPYNFFHIDNANGRELNLRYEFFNDSDGNVNLCPQLRLSCNPMMPVSSVLRPYNYKGINSHNDNQYGKDVSSEQNCCAESIDLTAYPLCTWSVDSYNAWLAQNSVPEAISVLTKGAEIGIGAIGLATPIVTGVGSAGALAGMALGSALNSVSQIMTNHYKASVRSDICKGSLNNANINFASKKQNFFIGRMSVNKQTGEIIDNFFDRFGYATNRVKIPNTHSRPHWNYVKTIGSNVGGNIPADDKKKIDDIFNNGLTFWKNASEVDNYSLDNSPT